MEAAQCFFRECLQRFCPEALQRACIRKVARLKAETASKFGVLETASSADDFLQGFEHALPLV